MSKQRSVSEVLKARGVVSYYVLWPREVLANMAVTLLALVIGAHLAESGRGSERRDSPAAGSGHGGNVVAEGVDGAIARVSGSRYDVALGHNGGLFEIAVGDSPVGVLGGDESVLNHGGKWVAPDVASSGTVKEVAAHAGSRGICSAEVGRVLGDQLGEVRGA